MSIKTVAFEWGREMSVRRSHIDVERCKLLGKKKKKKKYFFFSLEIYTSMWLRTPSLEI